MRFFWDGSSRSVICSLYIWQSHGARVRIYKIYKEKMCFIQTQISVQLGHLVLDEYLKERASTLVPKLLLYIVPLLLHENDLTSAI